MKGNIHFIVALLMVVIFSSCKKDEENPNGFAEGQVTEFSTNVGLENVLITVVNSNENLPIQTTTTNAEGNFSLELLPGSYYLRLSKQGYQSIPPKQIAPVPFNIVQGSTQPLNYEMSPALNAVTGWITGSVKEGSNPISGALVVATSGDLAVSAISDNEGNYVINNVPTGSFEVKAWLSGYNSDTQPASVAVDQATEGVNLTLTSGASGVFKGQIKNLATDNKDVDIALVHPITGETIPGLVTFSAGQTFQINNVPSGIYIARATYENDNRVMDPDRIAKFGEPIVEINSNTVELSFDITNSVTINSPTNSATEIVPMEITSITPTFKWTPYSSTSDYVIEVSDVNGNVIWGGFSVVDGLPSKNVSIPSSQTEVVYNFDGSANPAELTPGKVYRWKVYASKNDVNSTTGWTLISASEDQLGIIKIIE